MSHAKAEMAHVFLLVFSNSSCNFTIPQHLPEIAVSQGILWNISLTISNNSTTPTYNSRFSRHLVEYVPGNCSPAVTGVCFVGMGAMWPERIPQWAAEIVWLNEVRSRGRLVGGSHEPCRRTPNEGITIACEGGPSEGHIAPSRAPADCSICQLSTDKESTITWTRNHIIVNCRHVYNKQESISKEVLRWRNLIR